MAERRKQRPQRARKTGADSGVVLAKLQSAEAVAVLCMLLERHPELVPEAEEIATGLIIEVDVKAVAEEVGHAILDVDEDDFEARSGSHSSGYTHPTEAAYQLMDEAIEPFLENMRRHIELGFEAAAIATCEGIVLGLYRCLGKPPNGVLGWAVDFPIETAVQTIEALARDSAVIHGRAWQLPAAFVKQVPLWKYLIE